MTDIVERLRDDPSAFPDTIKKDCAEAADEIERLRKDNDELRTTLGRAMYRVNAELVDR